MSRRRNNAKPLVSIPVGIAAYSRGFSSPQLRTICLWVERESQPGRGDSHRASRSADVAAPSLPPAIRGEL
jgi:hypothetical protein